MNKLCAYNDWETDGRGHQQFGYLRIEQGIRCFSQSAEVLADAANRYPHYRYVVSYQGFGWVPTAILARGTAPPDPVYSFAPHYRQRA